MGPLDLAPASPAVSPLDELAAEANRRNRLSEEAYRSALDHAWHAGQALLAAKAQVAHGDWLAWLGANFAGSERHARRLMTLARADRTRVADLDVAGASLRGALQELAPAKPRGSLHAAFGDVGAARAELGIPPEGAPWPEPEYVSLRSGVARRTWQDIERAARKAELKRQTLRDVRGLVPEAYADLALEAAAEHRGVADGLEALAKVVLEQRRR